MKTRYVVGAVALGIIVSGFAGAAYLMQRHIDMVNKVVAKAGKVVESYHHVLLRRSQYLFGDPERRYAMLRKACWEEVREILDQEYEPIRKTAEPRVDHYIKQVIYRDLP
ncbi:hypothetical protein [Pseudomonas phage PA1C]|uniref:Uncharacterized protein n=1 Tax=Pseudomonas phage vB_PaeM_PS119XW TaxID=2601632 RepID=A0A5C1K7G7_9CAUD|nr:hypothetical protein PP933_gp116 [Pseudomonas phage vB_PaeM_PS119XW]QBX32271.1 hypothetical protein [Pseudomonas phage PA1C]QEM41845.1 hypothetical protein [Pseudomonas phage vB_PaeM_PS119XW]